MEILLSAIVSLVTMALKKLVAKWGANAVHILVFVLSLIAAWVYTLFGHLIDWTFVAKIFGIAFAWYQVVIKPSLPTVNKMLGIK